MLEQGETVNFTMTVPLQMWSVSLKSKNPRGADIRINIQQCAECQCESHSHHKCYKIFPRLLLD